jgi:hypothetical protein
MNELDLIGATYGTEKSSFRHDYLRHYDHLFARLRHEKFNFIEIDVLEQASLATWRFYFENANIIGVDSQDHGSCNAREGISVEVGSRDDPGFLYSLTHRYPPHIICDNGSHRSHHVLFTFERLFPALEPGGYYIVEGLRSFQAARRELQLAGPSLVNPIEYFFDLSRTLVTTELDSALDWGFRAYARDWIDEVLIFRNCCVIRKKPLARRAFSKLNTAERLAATIGTAEAWERAALLISATGGSVERIVAALNKAINLDPSSRLFRHLCEVHATAGRMDEALLIAQRAADELSQHDRTEALEYYGNMLLANHQVNKALEVFTTALGGVTHPTIRQRIQARIAEHRRHA